MRFYSYHIALIISLAVLQNPVKAQRNIRDYYLMAFPNGIQFDVEVTNEIVDSKNAFLEYASYTNSYEQILVQAKIYPAKGNDLLVIVREMSDMQCTWHTEYAYEIDEETDSLKAVSFADKFILNG